jgi:hypothetical protein
MHPDLAPGDFVIASGQTHLVWATSSTAIVALTLRVKDGPSQTRCVELGRVPFATLLGPSVVDITDRAELRRSDCIKIGRLTDEQSRAVRLAIQRTENSAAAEATDRALRRSTEIFRACQPSFRSGGRRVGGARVGV